MNREEIIAFVAQLTLEEKAALTSGQDNWNTKVIERLGIPSSSTSDGPHGLRTQDGSINSLSEDASISAVCFPAACATASSFDRDLIGRMGKELGRECQSAGVNILLGPGINIKRSPLCGRNFEYFSEDPFLSGELGASFVEGLQSEGIGACLKHFFANNQEYRRMDASSEMDERTMREIYLAAFEAVVKKAKPWSIMASYNKIDGIYSTANKKYLTEVLRDEWEFNGLVMSDWGAVHNRREAIVAGCDLTMPSEDTDGDIVKAVQEGQLSESVLDACCEHVISLAFRGKEQQKDNVEFDYDGGHALSREIARQSIVLLKNESELLPLSKTENVAYIGAFAATPRYQGGGSSHINSFKVTNALETAQNIGLQVAYAQGYNYKDGATNEILIREAVELAKTSKVAVVFAGLTDIMETEGVDRRHMQLPEGHNRLIKEICVVQPNTVVVLHNGTPVEMPWVDSVPAILEAYLGGQAIGEAIVDVLYGDINPSGHLAESFPKKLEDTPSYLFYPGERGIVQYCERMFVGYRYYVSKGMDVLFPFGHGLSYTTFSYNELSLEKKEIDQDETVTVSVSVTNTGTRAGKALVQLYVAPPKGEIIRPIRELKEFKKVDLQPRETRIVTMILGKRAFAYWNPLMSDWCVENGTYRIQIGDNSNSILMELPIEVTAKEYVITQEYIDTTPMTEFVKHPDGKQFIEDNIGHMISGMADAGFIPKELLMAFGYQIGKQITLEGIEGILQHAGALVGGGNGLTALMSQPILIMLGFIPDESKRNFKELLKKMNGCISA